MSDTAPAFLGLDPDATDEQIADRRARIEDFLDSAPADLQGWAAHAREDVISPKSPIVVSGPKKRSSGWMYLSAFLAGMLIVLTTYTFGGWNSSSSSSSSQAPQPSMPSNHPDINQAGMETPPSSQELAARAADAAAKVKANPASVDLRIQYAGALYSQGKYAQAKTELDEAIKLDPKSSQAYYPLGFVYLMLDPPQPSAAEQAWKKVVELEKGSEFGKHTQGLIDRLHQNISTRPSASAWPTPSATPSK